MHPLDILYTPLDVPVMPTVDMPRLREWMKVSAAEQTVSGRLDGKEITDPDVYPWDGVYCNISYQWYNNFDTLFPELTEYFKTVFSVPAKHIYNIYLLPLKEDRIGTHYWHADPDQNGLRLYLENDEVEDFLYVKATKKPYTSKLDSPTINLKWTIDDIQQPTHSARLLRSTQAFYLNNFRAVHAVNSHKLKSQRIAVVFALDSHYSAFPELMDLITRSAVTYKDHAILWSPPME